MVRKFFSLDKNYLLKEAQLQLQEKLLASLIVRTKEYYFIKYNPLRLQDTVTQAIENYQPEDFKLLNTFYQNLAAVYRYKFGDNQLEFLWDGNNHIDKYHQDWSDFFVRCTREFGKQELFIRAVLDLTVFLPRNRQAQLAENRMNHFIRQHFDIKIHKQRGIVEMKVA